MLYKPQPCIVDLSGFQQTASFTLFHFRQCTLRRKGGKRMPYLLKWGEKKTCFAEHILREGIALRDRLHRLISLLRDACWELWSFFLPRTGFSYRRGVQPSVPKVLCEELAASSSVSRMSLSPEEKRVSVGAGHLVWAAKKHVGGGPGPGQHRRRIPPKGVHHARTPAGRLRLRRHQPL